MKTIIVERTVYVEVIRQPVATPAPVTARVVEPDPRALPQGQQPRIDDLVEYTSKGGRTATYRVFWVGAIQRDGEVIQRVGLKGYNRKNGFFVDAAECTYKGRCR